MNKKIIEKDKKRLNKIGSNKDPILFFKKINENKKNGNLKFYVNHSLILNFGDNEHGCKFKCKFCKFKTHLLMQQKQVPTKKDIDKFLEGYGGYKVYISGGGDPLFEYEKNKDELNSIIDYLNEKGYLVNLITKEIDKAYLLADKINQFNFSVEKISINLLSQIKRIKELNPDCDIRISKIFNEKENIHYYIDYINYYLDYVDYIFIREDYNKKNFDNTKLFLKLNLIKNYIDKNKIVLFESKNCDISKYLIGNKEYNGNQMLSEKFQIKGDN